MARRDLIQRYGLHSPGHLRRLKLWLRERIYRSYVFMMSKHAEVILRHNLHTPTIQHFRIMCETLRSFVLLLLVVLLFFTFYSGVWPSLRCPSCIYLAHFKYTRKNILEYVTRGKAFTSSQFLRKNPSIFLSGVLRNRLSKTLGCGKFSCTLHGFQIKF